MDEIISPSSSLAVDDTCRDFMKAEGRSSSSSRRWL